MYRLATCLWVSDLQCPFVNHNDDICTFWGAKIRRKNVKRDILHKNIASEYDILQEMAFQNAIFYIITLQFVVLSGKDYTDIVRSTIS